jgi:hypothetical protein
VITRHAGDFGIGRDEGIDAEKRFGGLVVPLHDGDGFGFSKGFSPAVVEPVGMGVDDWWRQVVELFEQAFSGYDGFAQDRIDEGADAGFSSLDGFVDGGVVGDVEDEDLAEADAEDVTGIGIEFAIAEFGNPMIEYAAVTEDAEKDGLEEAAIGGGEFAALGVAIDEGLRVVMAFSPCAERGYGSLADVEVFGWHETINFKL